MNQREIKFRAWEEKFKKMVFNLLLDERGGLPELNTFLEMMQRHNPIMQYTGLKDKNGKDIYEDDILRYTFLGTRPEDEILILPVIFHEGVYALATINGEPLTLREAIKASNKASGLEIIGNIYENPELLK